ncbi:MAG TPA: hypothetical protein VLN49_24145 [Gemmatimonadaceae bacterium]|nr:hypothetical protein [Gemmatimonadaceae bacterium]
MIRRYIAIAVLLALPTTAWAQRGGGRTQSDRRTELFDKDAQPKGPSLRARDIDDQNPLKLLIEKRKDLKLSDAQAAALKDAESKLHDQNAPLFKAVDSLVHEMRPPLGSPSDEDRRRIGNARMSVVSVLGSVWANDDAAAKEAVAALDAGQQTNANALLEKQKDERQKMVQDKLRDR